jgi:hypothetical protein
MGVGFQACTPPHSYHYGTIAVDPQGNVLLAGTEGQGNTSMVFLAKLAP